MNTYIIHWKTIVNSFSSRGGYSVIDAADKNEARRSLRRNLQLFNGETLRIIGGAQPVGARGASAKSPLKGV